MATKITSERLGKMEREILELKEQCNQIRERQTFLVPVESLAPEAFGLKRPFQVVVKPVDGEYEAT